MSEQAPAVNATSFTVERRFRIWRYTVSHMTLLLRSAAWHEGEETVDIWFDGVALMNLHERYEQLTIRAAVPDERDLLLERAGGRIHPAMKKPPLCLILASDQSEGSIVCAHARVTATTRGPGIVGAPPVDADSGRLLWSAGPTGSPQPRHGYTLHPAGHAFLDAQHAQPGPDEQTPHPA
ncbi:hypothetical protein [Kitasatospora sp. P5_F3]